MKIRGPAGAWALVPRIAIVVAAAGALCALADEPAAEGRTTLWELARRHASTVRFSTLFTAQDVRDSLSTPEGIDKAIEWCKRTAVTRVYLETFRDGYTADEEALRRAKRRFLDDGFLVRGCVTTTGIGRKSVKGWSFPCFTEQAGLENLARIFRFTAGIFDEIMIDDFFATTCECAECVAARGERPWSELRCDLLVDVSTERVLAPARAVNPDVKVILKYPQWYEDFHNRGYDVVRETAMYDGIWVGTETRDPDNERWGRKSQYEAYFIMRWLGEIGGPKTGGGWFDPYGTSPATYVEQARQTVLAGAREALLFCYGSLQRGSAPDNVAALREELPLLFELATLVRDKAPRGIAAPKPPGSDAGGDRYVYDFLGLLGLPLVPSPELRADAPAALLTAHALKDPRVEEKLATMLEARTPLLVTQNFVAERGKGPLPDHVRVIDVPRDAWGLMDDDPETLNSMRGELLAPLGLAFEAPTRVALYVLGDDLAVVENFNDRSVRATIRAREASRPELLLSIPARNVPLSRDGGLVALDVPARSLVALKLPTAVSRRTTEADLLDLDDFDTARAVTEDAGISIVARDGKRALRVEAGHAARWPGVTLRAPSVSWDLSGRTYLSVELRNAGTRPTRVHCRVDNPGADGVKHCVTESIALEPGERGTITALLTPRLLAKGEIEFIGMRGDPPVTSELDPANVTQLVLFVNRTDDDHIFEIEGIHAGGERCPTDTPLRADAFFPMIDELGQYVHASWPGKTGSVEDLAARGAAEREELENEPGPPDRDRYGGWAAGPALEATGFFRVEKRDGRWWLVDPEGRLFWSHGIDCVHPSASTPISDRERYYRGLPDTGQPLARFYGTGSWAPHGYYKDHTPYRTYDFFRANLLRKYGDDWEREFADVTHQRLRSWGLNTIANWSDRGIYEMRRTPYTATVNSGGKRIEGSKGYWGRFPDVFDPSFRDSLRERFARERGRTAGDPWCIGYFVDNELSWGDDVSLAAAALESPPEQAAKRAFVAALRETYDTIDRLNASWGTRHASWDALLESTEAPDTVRARKDLTAFTTQTAETYFRVVRESLKEVAPQQLYLGVRFAWVNDLAARAAAKYCDVVSYNRYTYDVEGHRLPDGIDKPVIIGEFHFGALDRGMFHTGLRKARDQEHRAELYASYVLGALRNPLIVGTHWFQYKDQATTGRGDGENYQIGFVDICDRPYPEIVRACREVGRRMYRYRLEGR